MSIEIKLSELTGDLPPGVTAGVALGTGLADGYDFYESPIGRVAVTFNPEGVSSVDTVEGFEERHSHRFGKGLIRAEAPRAWRRLIPAAIEAGSPGSLPVDLRSVTDFQRQVLTKTATIPRGEVRPYGWIAREIDRPKAVRAVGTAVARNPVPLIVPCHRVVRTDGHIGNYSLGGPANKLNLLDYEGAHPTALEDLAAHGVRVQGNSTTHIYCLPTCRAIRASNPDNVVDFRSMAVAEGAGYRACKVCRPAVR